ncbi:MAG: signal peptide peptidase SppA [Bacteroidales bacterium]|nr:signal peptide peptidase SppA [Bacteroidales bacterium]
MKSFFKYLLASILGVLIAAVILFFISMGVITALVSSQDKAVDIKSNTILMLKLDQPINDRKSPLPMLVVNLTSLGAGNAIGLNDILDNIAKAGQDENISGIYLELSGLQTGIATIEEIRNALADFKKKGKFVIAYSDTYTQGSYYLASVSDKVYLNPEGSVNLIGLSAEIMFYKKALEKLDIEPEIIRHGKFKSAIEPFMYDKMSPENREQIRQYVGSIWDQMVEQMASSRNITVEKMNTFADSLLMWNNSSAIAYGIIDRALYKDQVLDTLVHLARVDKIKDLNFITHHKYLRVPETSDRKGYSRNKIAVIYAEGDIVTGEQSDGFIGSAKIARTIREARQDSTIKAIVFRVNSPGGSVLASEVIHRELYLAHQTKPVIASMGDVAASGGYYVVAAADTIVASPNTITGSIGVFGLLLNAGDFLENKLGITVDVENTNAYSDFPSVFRPLSAPERLTLQKMIDGAYSTFVTHVSDGRSLPWEQVDKIAEGRVWSGKNALELGLIDTLGGLTTAVEIAAKKAKLDHYRIVELPKPEDPFDQIMKELSGNVKERFLRNELSGHYKQYKLVKQVLQSDKIQARLPYDLNIH